MTKIKILLLKYKLKIRRFLTGEILATKTNQPLPTKKIKRKVKDGILLKVLLLIHLVLQIQMRSKVTIKVILILIILETLVNDLFFILSNFLKIQLNISYELNKLITNLFKKPHHYFYSSIKFYR